MSGLPRETRVTSRLMNNLTSPLVLRCLCWVGLLSLLVRLWIGYSFPITGDEAYFYWWGRYPDWGYYDHPPMAGWWIALMLQVLGDSTLAIRMPAIVLPLALGAALWWGFSPLHRDKTAWAILLLWLTPIHWLNALMTTDTPLIFWSVLSVCALARAESPTATPRHVLFLHVLSGLFLGLAFLSKYFAVVIGLAYLVYFVSLRRDRFLLFVVLVLSALPGPIINLMWNMEHGWANIMFNVFNRNQGASFAWHNPALYAATLLYLLTPAVAWVAWRERATLGKWFVQQPLVMTIIVVPVFFFGLISIKKVVGLHWLLNFYPFMFVALAFALPMQHIKTCAKGLLVFSGLHLVVLAGLYSTQLADWQETALYPKIVRSYRTEALLAQVTSHDTVLMTTSYTPAAIYGQTLKTYVPVFGTGSHHARQDDLVIDFSAFNGKTIRILDSEPADLKAYAPFFDSVSQQVITQDKATFYVVEGKQFNANAYKDRVLRQIMGTYHQIPTWLPMTGCPICLQYCQQVRCPSVSTSP